MILGLNITLQKSWRQLTLFLKKGHSLCVRKSPNSKGCEMKASLDTMNLLPFDTI